MKKLLFVLLLTPLSVWGQTAFDGTWRVDLSKAQLPKKPDKYLLQNGTYKCETCAPPFEVKADGQDHKVTGHPFFDILSVRVVNDKTVELTEKRNGKIVGTDKSTVSDDGNQLAEEFTANSHNRLRLHPKSGFSSAVFFQSEFLQCVLRRSLVARPR